jgi:hypothetical protein
VSGLQVRVSALTARQVLIGPNGDDGANSESGNNETTEGISGTKWDWEPKENRGWRTAFPVNTVDRDRRLTVLSIPWGMEPPIPVAVASRQLPRKEQSTTATVKEQLKMA